jgi:hypothetical protein
MVKMFIFGILLAVNAQAASYCENYDWDSSTKFEGPVGEVGAFGIATYLGSNPTPSDNIGTYEFKTANSFVMEFAGEPRHVCVRKDAFDWSCKMGRWLRYSLECEF